jgi:hypothetical protein
VTLLSDISGEVVSWAGHEGIMFIELRLSATLGGRPLDFRAVDKLWLTQTGTVLRRDSFFDSGPLIQAVLCRPSPGCRGGDRASGLSWPGFSLVDHAFDDMESER